MASVRMKRNLKVRLYKQQCGVCYYCKSPMMEPTGGPHPLPNNYPTVDHIVPISTLKKKRGYIGDRNNVVLACQKCNHLKASSPAPAFIQFLISTGVLTSNGTQVESPNPWP